MYCKETCFFHLPKFILTCQFSLLLMKCEGQACICQVFNSEWILFSPVQTKHHAVKKMNSIFFCHFVQKSPNGGFNIQLQEKNLFGLQKQTSLEVSSLQSNFVRIIGAGLLFMWWKDNLIVNNFPFYYLSSQISPFSSIFFLAPS